MRLATALSVSSRSAILRRFSMASISTGSSSRRARSASVRLKSFGSLSSWSINLSRANVLGQGASVLCLGSYYLDASATAPVLFSFIALQFSSGTSKDICWNNLHTERDRPPTPQPERIWYSFAPMRIFVLGTGATGSYLAHLLVRQGH